MKILETLLLAGVVTTSHLGYEVWAHKQPLSLTTTFSLGQDKNSATASHKIGYVGVTLNGNVIGQVFEGSSADTVGLLAGDKIMEINDKSIFGLEGVGIADKLRGPEGAIVELVVEHGDALRKVKLTLGPPVAAEAAIVSQQLKVSPLVE
jgi:C-terminal processing protease CtpA/Prc